MNKQRRAALAKALPMLAEAAKILAEARTRVSDVKDDEEEAYNGLSEGSQNGDAGQAMNQAYSDMSDALDALDAIDLKEVVRIVAETAERAEPEIEPARLGEDELRDRRMARLAPWARQELDRAAAAVAKAEGELATSFREADPEATRQITVDEYGSPLRGRVVPSDQVAFPRQGIRASVTRDGKAVEIHGLDMGSIVVMPYASNTIHVRTERRF